MQTSNRLHLHILFENMKCLIFYRKRNRYLCSYRNGRVFDFCLICLYFFMYTHGENEDTIQLFPDNDGTIFIKFIKGVCIEVF